MSQLLLDAIQLDPEAEEASEAEETARLLSSQGLVEILTEGEWDADD